MKKIIIIILLTLTLFGCSSNTNGYRKIDSKEAIDLIENGAILIDVRTEEEYNVSHIEGAINIPNTMLEMELPKRYFDKNTTIIVYCRSGSRSKAAANLLYDMGYINVYDLGSMGNFNN